MWIQVTFFFLNFCLILVSFFLSSSFVAIEFSSHVLELNSEVKPEQRFLVRTSLFDDDGDDAADSKPGAKPTSAAGGDKKSKFDTSVPDAV
jgi:hypothetical protein